MRAQAAVKGRPRHELSMALFRPPALALAGGLARAGVRPEVVVVSHCLIGLAAAWLVHDASPQGWLVAAVLLQAKTVLDNADGALARGTGTVTELGRYLDTVLDFVVNVALFVALAAHGPAALSLLALVALTLVLSWDFNAERLYREARAEKVSPAPAARSTEAVTEPDPAPRVAAAASSAVPEPGRGGVVLRAFRRFYLLVFEPQDRLVGRVDATLFRAAGGRNYRGGSEERLAWSDLFSTAALVDLGLSTQFLVLGACLALREPYLYVYLVLLQGCYLTLVQTVRVIRFRRRFGKRAAA